MNEELHVIEDTLIVEFDGFGMNEGIGRYRRWTSRLASGEDLVLLLEVSDNKQIFYFPGPANYYMVIIILFLVLLSLKGKEALLEGIFYMTKNY